MLALVIAATGAVVQVAAQRFDVTPELTWVACPTGTAVGDVYNGSGFSRPGAPTPPPPTLATRRAALGTERYNRQSIGVMFKASGASAPALVASDPASIVMLNGSYAAARDGYWVDGTPWKVADGSFVPLTAADMKALAIKVLGYIAQCFAREAQLSAALGSDLTTDITLGWPVNT